MLTDPLDFLSGGSFVLSLLLIVMRPITRFIFPPSRATHPFPQPILPATDTL